MTDLLLLLLLLLLLQLKWLGYNVTTARRLVEAETEMKMSSSSIREDGGNSGMRIMGSGGGIIAIMRVQVYCT